MIPERLMPLLERLKNPPELDQRSLEARLLKETGPTTIKLIESGISLKLARQFNELEKFEEFICRAGIIISNEITTKEDKEAFAKKYIDKEFNKVLIALEILHDICNNGKRGTFKIWQGIVTDLGKLKKKFLANIKISTRPDGADNLIRLFKEMLPKANQTFIDRHVIKMLAPFDINYQPGTVRKRSQRPPK